MKAKNGKCGVFVALTAALLVTAALITSCPAEVVTVYRDGYQPPEGMGYLMINAPGFTGERTVLPSAGTWVSYDLSIQQYSQLSGGTPVGGAITKSPVTNLQLPINLAPGYYTLTVMAKTSVGDAAQGLSSGFQISAGTGTQVSVTLKPLPYTTATGIGSFVYSINFNSLPATAEMTISALVDGATSTYATPQAVSEGITTTVPLTPGSYIVFVEATVNDKTASITEIVNIHQNLTSSVNFDFNGGYFVAYINGINTTFTPDDVRPIMTKSTGTPAVNENTTITLSFAVGASEIITITNEDKFDTITWYCGGTSGSVSGGTFTITANAGPFIDLVIYPVTVVGKTATGAHSTSFKVSIIN